MTVSYPIQISADSPFGIYNIPFGIFSTKDDVGRGSQRRAGTAVGNFVLELDALVKHGIFDNVSLTKPLGDVFLAPDLNGFSILPASDRSLVRQIIIENLTKESSPLFTDKVLNERAFIPATQVQMHLPMTITGFSDFFSSYIHAKNCESLIGGSVPKAFYEYPMAYNGRVSSIAVSGTPVIRPRGYYNNSSSNIPHATYQASQKLDFEVEMGILIGPPIPAGKHVTAANASEHIFGLVLLNDWSSRDIQGHEMFPFGPFHSKSFLTSVSPWVVTLDALQGSLSHLSASHEGGEKLAPSLREEEGAHGLFDVQLDAYLERRSGGKVKIIETNLASSHWDPFQIVSYQSSSGCGLRTGDLLGTGTISSPNPRGVSTTEEQISTFGCLSEINHTKSVLPKVSGKSVTWLEDGDTFSYDGWFKSTDGGKIGFGPVTGTVLPALTDD